MITLFSIEDTRGESHRLYAETHKGFIQNAGDRVPANAMNKSDTGYFEEIEHTADLSLRCGGPDLESLFRNAARGMYHLMGATSKGVNTETRHAINLAAEDVESLLVDWLGELAYLAESRGIVFEEMTFESLSPTRLEAMLVGGPTAHMGTLVKAVTYHQLKVERSEGGFTATVVFDV
jgi:SHS2 domain-containing protein